MKQLTHDNENDTWSTLGLAAARVLVKLGDEKQKDSERNAQRDHAADEKESNKRKAIEDGLRRIQLFEDSYRRGDRAGRQRR